MNFDNIFAKTGLSQLVQVHVLQLTLVPVKQSWLLKGSVKQVAEGKAYRCHTEKFAVLAYMQCIMRQPRTWKNSQDFKHDLTIERSPTQHFQKEPLPITPWRKEKVTHFIKTKKTMAQVCTFLKAQHRESLFLQDSSHISFNNFCTNHWHIPLTPGVRGHTIPSTWVTRWLPLSSVYIHWHPGLPRRSLEVTGVRPWWWHFRARKINPETKGLWRST